MHAITSRSSTKCRSGFKPPPIWKNRYFYLQNHPQNNPQPPLFFAPEPCHTPMCKAKVGDLVCLLEVMTRTGNPNREALEIHCRRQPKEIDVHLLPWGP